MNILDVSPRVNVPPRRGSHVRSYYLLSHLSAFHNIVQFSQDPAGTLRPGKWVDEVGVTPTFAEIRYRNWLACLLTNAANRTWVKAPVLSGEALRITRPRALRELLHWADTIFVEFPWQYRFCRSEKPHGRFVYVSHNVEYDKFASYARASGVNGARSSWLRRIRYLEECAVAEADLILAVSPEDRRRFAELYGAGLERVLVVPNGTDTEVYHPVSPDVARAAKGQTGLPDRPTVLFLGGSTAPPQAEGFRWMARLAERSRDYTFVVVGGVAASESANQNLIVTGPVWDQRPYLQAADYFLCPIQYGGGTKMKLLEALAAGLPTVAFEESLRGTLLRDQEHVLVADKKEDRVLEALARLAASPEEAREMSARARELVVSHYDWRLIAGRLNQELLLRADS